MLLGVLIALALPLTLINHGLEIDSAVDSCRRLGLVQARKLSEYNEAPAPSARPRFDEAAQISELEKVLHVAFPSREAPALTPGEAPFRAAGRDFSSAIDLVREAADFMRSTDDRARESELRMQEIVQRATDELKAAEARVHAADARTRAAEARAADAEKRLKDAEQWLERIYDVIAEELPSRPAPR